MTHTHKFLFFILFTLYILYSFVIIEEQERMFIRENGRRIRDNKIQNNKTVQEDYPQVFIVKTTRRLL